MSLLTEKRVFFSISLLVFVYIVLRAFFLPLYVDELYSFNHYVRTGFLSPFNDYKAANNHLLNTFLTTISYSLFGDSPFSLRLFNVLAFIPFAFYLHKVGEMLIHKVTRWSFYLVLLCSLNFLSYFSLSRGYGLSFALILMSIYYVIKTFNKRSIRIIGIAIVVLFLALYANFSLLLFVLISFGVIGVNVIKYRNYYFLRANIIKFSLLGLVVVLFIGFALKVLFYYKEAGELWWGSLDGFWSVTILSLIQFLFRTEDTAFLYQGAIVFLSVVMFVVYLVKEPFRDKLKKTNLFFIYLFLNVLGILIMANLFDVNYPFQRTGLHLYVFFIGAYCFGIDKLKNKILRIILILPFFFMPIHFLLNMNLTYVSCWEQDNLPDSFYEKVKSIEIESQRKYPMSIYIEGTAVACWTYSANKDDNALPNAILGTEKNIKYYDYIIDTRKNVAPVKDLYDSLDFQPSSEVCLYKRKEEVERILIKESLDTGLRETNSEFLEFVRFEVDSMTSSSLFFDVKANFEYLSYPFQTNIILSVKNLATDELIGYKPIRLDLKEKWSKNDVLRHGNFINELPVDEKLLIVVYVWNTKGVQYKLHSSEVKIYNVIE